MNEDFKKKAEIVKALMLDQDTQLLLYGLYKQATQGDNTNPEPSDFISLAKHKSWLSHLGKSSEEAQAEYIKIVQSFVGEGWKLGLSRPVFEEEAEDLTEEEGRVKVLCESVKNSEINESLIQELGVNCRDKNGLTPLHHAVDEGLCEISKMLIERGADVNLQDNEGMTPGHYAVELENSDVLKVLLESGRVDVNIRDNDGKSISDIASGNCAELLRTLVSNN